MDGELLEAMNQMLVGTPFESVNERPLKNIEAVAGLVTVRGDIILHEANEDRSGAMGPVSYTHLLVSGHGAWIRGAICTVQGFDKADFWKGNEQKNCSITLLECQNGKWKLLQDAVSAEALVRMGKSGRI